MEELETFAQQYEEIGYINNIKSWIQFQKEHTKFFLIFRTTSTSSPQAKSPAGSSAGAVASASTAPGDRTPTAHNKQLQNVKGQDHPPHPSVSRKIH